MSRDWKQEIANIEWIDVLEHVVFGLAVAGILIIIAPNKYHWIAAIIGIAGNFTFWPAREMYQSGKFGVRGWSVKKWLEGFAPGVVVTPFMVMFI